MKLGLLLTKRNLAASLLSFIAAFPIIASAQTGSGAALLISGLDGAGDGCQNLTGFEPPRYPGFAGGIPCREFMVATSTQLGAERLEQVQLPATLLGRSEPTTVSDLLNVAFVSRNHELVANYGQGNEHYAEFAEDSARRVRFYEARIQNRELGAKNANEFFEFARAVAKVVDGRAIAMSIEGDNGVVEVSLGDRREIEIFPFDPDQPAVLTNPSQNPFSLSWIGAGASTPHLSIPSGIAFNSRFDSEAGRWRYFLVVNGEQLGEAGRYIVYFQILRETPITIRYDSFIDGQIRPNVWQERQQLTATLLVEYGLDQCVHTNTINTPSILPAIQSFERAIAASNKIMKRYKKDKGNSSISRIRRATKASRRFVREARELETIGQSTDILRMDPVDAQRLLDGLKQNVTRAIGKRQLFTSYKGAGFFVRLWNNYRRTVLGSKGKGVPSPALRAELKFLKEFDGIFNTEVSETQSMISVQQLSIAQCQETFPGMPG